MKRSSEIQEVIAHSFAYMYWEFYVKKEGNNMEEKCIKQVVIGKSPYFKEYIGS